MAKISKSFEYLKGEYKDSCDIVVSPELIGLFPFSMSEESKAKFGRNLGGSSNSSLDSLLFDWMLKESLKDSIHIVECYFPVQGQTGCMNHYLQADFTTIRFNYFQLELYNPGGSKVLTYSFYITKGGRLKLDNISYVIT